MPFNGSGLATLDMVKSLKQGEERENLGDFWKAWMDINVAYPATTCPPSFHKTDIRIFKRGAWSQPVCNNKILNIKPGTSQISGTLEFLIHEYGRNDYWWKNTNFQRLIGTRVA